MLALINVKHDTILLVFTSLHYVTMLCTQPTMLL